MNNILLIGLDKLSKKIIDYLKVTDYNIIGFDFDIDKINLFSKQRLIINSSHIQLNDLLKEADIIILNIEFSKYEKIFKLLPFIKNTALIINTNICKGNINKIKSLLKNRAENFMPCNFLLFPNNVIINYDSDVKMQLISKTSDFFRKLKIKTSVLNPIENDKIFANLYQIPFLFNKVLFKNEDYSFISNNLDYTEYNFFFEDLLLNKNNILQAIENFLDNIPNIKNNSASINLLENNNLENLKFNENLENNITDELVLKIFIEKIFIKTFISKYTEYHINFKLLNFDYIRYDKKVIEIYFLNNRLTFEISIMIIREKIINLSSFLHFDELPLNKFLKFLNSI